MKLMRFVKPLMQKETLRHIPRESKIRLLEGVCQHGHIEYDLVDDDEKKTKENFEHLILVKGGNDKFVQRMQEYYKEYYKNRVNIGRQASDDLANNMIDAFDGDIV